MISMGMILGFIGLCVMLAAILITVQLLASFHPLAIISICFIYVGYLMVRM